MSTILLPDTTILLPDTTRRNPIWLNKTDLLQILQKNKTGYR